MAAAANTIGAETYYPPGSGGAGTPAFGRTRTSDFSDEPPTKRVRKKP
jgi:hypothetical protein